jgi:Ca-activated chloride channel family protein
MKYIISLGIICLFAFTFIANEGRTVEGIVMDENGKPVAGASVVIKGTTTGTTTHANGYFKIVVPVESAVLVISAVNYETTEITLHGEKTIKVTLHGANSLLNEVVVTALGVLGKHTRPYAIQGKAAGAYLRSDMAGRVQQSEALKGYNNADTTLQFNREGYDKITENPFLKVQDNPLSTFSIDVDAASYSNVRRFINNKELPPAGAVRIEEMINYFTYQYPQPQNGEPFSVNTELSQCPWNKNHRLMLIGLQGKIIPAETLPASNLVFLIDVSGSMMEENKLPLVQSSLKLLTDQLRPQDKVSIVVYAGNAGLVLPSTSGDHKTTIKDAIDRLEAGGSTAGGAGIKLAYATAKQNFIQGGNNRVILCTDGDFNIGVSSDDELETLIEQKRETGVFLTVLGYGMGNYQDAKMQKLADKGNGNHAYIDGIGEAKKVLIHEFGGTLFTIAKDVKLQIEFNPTKVQGYRLIGYENRLLAKEDFNNDKKDAGELGSGHTVTALYEIIPAGVPTKELANVDALRYQTTKQTKPSEQFTNELLNIKLRYKQPDESTSKLLQHLVKDDNIILENTSSNFRFAAAVASFGMLLRHSQYKGNFSYDDIVQLASQATGSDTEGYRKEFIQLVQNAEQLKDKPVAMADTY